MMIFKYVLIFSFYFFALFMNIFSFCFMCFVCFYIDFIFLIFFLPYKYLTFFSLAFYNFLLFRLNFFLLPGMALKSHIQNLVYGKSFSFLSLAHINQIWLL